MATPSLLSTTAFHILSYGTLLGTQMFETFVNGIVAYQVLPRPQFAQFQTKIFPYYMGIQTILPVVMALTYPVTHNSTMKSSIDALQLESNRWTALIPIAAMFLSGLSNWVYFGPATTRNMVRRKHQETRDGKKYWEAGPHSKEMEQLNQNFMILHSLSSLANVVELGVTIWYGMVLARRITLV